MCVWVHKLNGSLIRTQDNYVRAQLYVYMPHKQRSK